MANISINGQGDRPKEDFLLSTERGTTPSLLTGVGSENEEKLYSEQDFIRYFHIIIQENSLLRKQLNMVKDQIQLKDEEIKRLKRDLEKYNQGNSEVIDSASPDLKFSYVYDLTDFDSKAECSDVEFLLDKLLVLAAEKIRSNVYVVRSGTDVAILYMVLCDSEPIGGSKYHYIGKLKNFCEMWNENVVMRIDDEDRRNVLLAKYASIKTEHASKKWTEVAPSSWRRLADDTTVRDHHNYVRAFNIKSRLEQLLFSR